MKDRIVARPRPPESAPIETVAREVGISVSTLERWRGEVLSLPPSTRAWTASARLDAVVTTASMGDEE